MLHLGHARVAALNLGTIAADLAEWLGVPRAEWGVSTPLFARLQPVPVQAALISVPGAAILVDACDPADLATLEPPPGYRPPPGLADQLAALGLHPADITHVVVTHLHADHYNGLVRAEGGAYAALCPNARHLVGRADWLAAQAAIADPATSRADGELYRETLPEPGRLPYFTVQFAWDAPLVSSAVDYQSVTGQPPVRRVLEQYANPEFNSEGGLAEAYIDYGDVGGAIYYLLMGLFVGWLYRLFAASRLLGGLVVGGRR